MERPPRGPFYSEANGVDKAAVVATLLRAGRTLAHAGDGYTDFDAARQIPAAHRFARADLAEACDKAGIAYEPFSTWDEIVATLT